MSENGHAPAKSDLETFKDWVIGLVTGCEGCTRDATAWVESLGEITTEYEATNDPSPPGT